MNSAVNIPTDIGIDDLSKPLTFPAEAYISAHYARAEGDKLWANLHRNLARYMGTGAPRLLR